MMMALSPRYGNCVGQLELAKTRWSLVEEANAFAKEGDDGSSGDA